MTPEALLRYLEMYIVYSMIPQVLVRYLERYIQCLLKYWSDT